MDASSENWSVIESQREEAGDDDTKSRIDQAQERSGTPTTDDEFEVLEENSDGELVKKAEEDKENENATTNSTLLVDVTTQSTTMKNEEEEAETTCIENEATTTEEESPVDITKENGVKLYDGAVEDIDVPKRDVATSTSDENEVTSEVKRDDFAANGSRSIDDSPAFMTLIVCASVLVGVAVGRWSISPVTTTTTTTTDTQKRSHLFDCDMYFRDKCPRSMFGDYQRDESDDHDLLLAMVKEFNSTLIACQGENEVDREALALEKGRSEMWKEQFDRVRNSIEQIEANPDFVACLKKAGKMAQDKLNELPNAVNKTVASGGEMLKEKWEGIRKGVTRMAESVQKMWDKYVRRRKSGEDHASEMMAKPPQEDFDDVDTTQDCDCDGKPRRRRGCCKREGRNEGKHRQKRGHKRANKRARKRARKQ